MAHREKKSAIIVGAGVGGVATAARLAQAGYHVSVYEKNDFTGGRCSLLYQDGYRFDQGPSLLLLPELFRETFADLGTSLEAEGVQLIKCEPNYRVWYHDGQSLELSTDTARMKPEIEKWEGKLGFQRYLSYLQEAHRHYEISVSHVLHRTFASFLAFLRPAVVLNLPALHPFESVWSRTSRYFKTERLRRAFTFASMYMGMSPFDAPGTYSLLQYTELAEGIWYPIGGFHAVIDALVRVGKRAGVQYHLSSPVAKVNIDPATGAATGVTLSSGKTYNADLTIINADLIYAENHLLPPSTAAKRLAQRETSCSSISFYWALSKQVPELDTHNIFLAEAFKASFDDIFKKHSLPADPSFYVNVPSRVDPSAAPPGTDAVVVLLPCGHLAQDKTSAQDWNAIVAGARTAILATMRARIGVDLTPLIAHERVNTPPSWQTAFNLDRGAILGLSHSFFNVLSFRPQMRSPRHDRLYFVGASTHPGTGVPIVLAGAKLLADTLLGRPEQPISLGPKPVGSRDVRLDRASRGLSWVQMLGLLVLILIVLYFRFYRA